MDWQRPKAIMRKEFWEFRRQKYILYSLLIPPVVLAVILPIASVAPFFVGYTVADPDVVDRFDPPTIELSLDHETIESYLENNTFNGVSFVSNARVNDSSFVGTVVRDSILERCEVADFTLKGSVIRDSVLVGGVVKDSLLVNVTVRSAVILNCSGLDVEIFSTSVIASDDLDIVSKDGLRSIDLIEVIIDSYTFLLVIAPAIIPTVIASYTFVGEKNNRSLEPLLATPATDKELLWGKILAIFVPCMGSTALAFVAFALITNALVAGPLQYAPFPNLTWLMAMLVLSPIVCFLSIAVNVLVSSKMSDVRASQQVGSLVILPVVVLFIGSLVGFVTLGGGMVLVSMLLLAVAIVVYMLVVKSFRRENILVKWK